MRSDRTVPWRRRTAVCILLGAGAVAVASCSSPSEQASAQSQGTQPPTAQAPAQPGITWNEERLKSAVAPVRAGRVLTPRVWPNGARVAVCLSFDVDNESFTLARGDTAPVTLSAGEYGATKGLPRVLDMLDRHKIAASFYIPAVSAQLHPQMVEEIRKRGRHEIGVHGWIHENLVELNDAAEEERLLTQAIDYLTKVSGKRPVGYRAPSWAFSQHTLGLIRKAGFLYDSSLMAMDEPYEIVSDGQPTGLIELPVEWILDDAPYFGRAGSLPSPAAIFEVYRDEFDQAYAEGTMMMLTMHPHVIGHRSRMVHLEKLIAYMKAKPGVWFATAEEIARATQRTGTTN
jgi:peptidoglycan/xylan/chitin deacetylase (PgdA/CDA1 family)